MHQSILQLLVTSHEDRLAKAVSELNSAMFCRICAGLCRNCAMYMRSGANMCRICAELCRTRAIQSKCDEITNLRNGAYRIIGAKGINAQDRVISGRFQRHQLSTLYRDGRNSRMARKMDKVARGQLKMARQSRRIARYRAKTACK